MIKRKIFNFPFLGSHTSNLGEIPLKYIRPRGLPTHQISSISEGVMCKTLVNWYGIDYLHVRTKECINTLITVMSWLDAVVTSMNVLNPMENHCCGTFKRMLWFKYTVHVNFVNNGVTAIQFHTLSSLLEANHMYWQRVTEQTISILCGENI